MLLDIRERGQGTTTQAIREAAVTGCVLLVPSCSKAFVRDKAKEMKCDVEIFSVNDLKVLDYTDKIIIDELPQVLKELVGCEVVKATISKEGYRRKLG